VLLYYVVSKQATELSLLRSLWVFVWLGLIVIIDHFSGFGGTGQLTHIQAAGLVVLVSIVIAICFEKCALTADKANQYLTDIETTTLD
jgi:NO-binding membrane sensor protein with MHYT domain